MNQLMNYYSDSPVAQFVGGVLFLPVVALFIAKMLKDVTGIDIASRFKKKEKTPEDILKEISKDIGELRRSVLDVIKNIKPSDQIVREIVTPEFIAACFEQIKNIPIFGKSIERRTQEFQHDINNIAQKDFGVVDALEHVEKSIVNKMDEHYPKQTKALNGLSEEIESLSEEITFLRKKIV